MAFLLQQVFEVAGLPRSQKHHLDKLRPNPQPTEKHPCFLHRYEFHRWRGRASNPAGAANRLVAVDVDPMTLAFQARSNRSSLFPHNLPGDAIPYRRILLCIRAVETMRASMPAHCLADSVSALLAGTARYYSQAHTAQ